MPRASGSRSSRARSRSRGHAHRVPGQRRGSGHVRAVSRRHSRVQRAGRARRSRRHVRPHRVHDSAVLRFADRQGDHLRPRSAGSHRAHAPRPRDDGHRGHPHIDSPPPEGSSPIPIFWPDASARRSWIATWRRPFRRRTTEGRRVILPPLYAIVDADMAAAHGWTVPRLAARACLQRRRAPAAGAREAACRAAPVLGLVRRGRGRRRSVRRDRDRERSADVARMAGAAGVHVGQDDLDAEGCARRCRADRHRRTLDPHGEQI